MFLININLFLIRYFGNCDPTVYVFQNKKTEEIIVCTRYVLAKLINKTSHSLSNLIIGNEKSAFGYTIIACPLPKKLDSENSVKIGKPRSR